MFQINNTDVITKKWNSINVKNQMVSARVQTILIQSCITLHAEGRAQICIALADHVALNCCGIKFPRILTLLKNNPRT